LRVVLKTFLNSSRLSENLLMPFPFGLAQAEHVRSDPQGRRWSCRLTDQTVVTKPLVLARNAAQPPKHHETCAATPQLKEEVWEPMDGWRKSRYGRS
jgi:hypothetical protein